MGAISTHMGENLMPSDRGISLYRRRIRRQIKQLAEGTEPPQPRRTPTVHTYGQDTVLNPARRRPPLTTGPFLRRVGETVMASNSNMKALDDEARDSAIIERLKELEASGLDRSPAT